MLESRKACQSVKWSGCTERGKVGALHGDHASESLQYQPGLSLRKLNRSPQLEVQQTFSKEAGEKEIISQKMFDLFLRMDILVGLLLLIFVNVVVGDKHRIKLEKGSFKRDFDKWTRDTWTGVKRMCDPKSTP